MSSALAGPYASLNLTYSSIPEELQPQFQALIRAIEEYAARQPGFEDKYNKCLEELASRFEREEPAQRRNFEDPLVATIALYSLLGPISWLEVGSRARVR